MRNLLIASLTGATLLIAGCGPNCQSTCQRLYADGSQNIGGDTVEDCGIERAGRSQTQLIDDCMNQCENALDTPGEMGPYDPYTRSGSSESVTIDNERQAAIWMQCIEETSCDRLTDGFCLPVP